MNRPTVDNITSDQLDLICDAIENVGSIASRLYVAGRTAMEREIGRELVAALAPLNSERTAAYDGPSIAEAAADDRRWWTTRYDQT